jgi:hypothetical protein
LIQRGNIQKSAGVRVPFLDDTTTQNVIVNQGALSGLVDRVAACQRSEMDAARTQGAGWQFLNSFDF